MKIALVRHGKTEMNAKGIIQGRSNNPLNDEGRKECYELKKKLSKKHFDVCYMSPLIRTVETAMILIGDKTYTIRDDRLLERNMGALEGSNWEEYDPIKYWDVEKDSTEKEVESVSSIYKRCEDFLKYIIKKHPKKNILVVTHAAPLRVLRKILLKKEIKGNLYDLKIGNCYYEEFEVNEKELFH